MFVVCLFIYSMLHNMHVSPNIQINTLFETELTVCDNLERMSHQGEAFFGIIRLEWTRQCHCI